MLYLLNLFNLSLSILAQNVTTTAANQGKFETRFFHMVYGDEFGRVRGHFGPINALDVHPFGKSFASGSEDG